MFQFCGSLPFMELGFIQTDENLWVKYTNEKASVPHFILSTTINPVSQTFLIKDLINDQMMSSNHFETIREFVVQSCRENNLRKILD
jgi:hypothetical protein